MCSSDLEVQVEDEEEEIHYHADGTAHAGPMHEGAFAEPPLGVGLEAGGEMDLASISSELKATGASAPKVTAKGLDTPKQPQNLTYSAPDETGHEEVRGSGAASVADDEFGDVGRNALCPCGSGKKYKRCHGAPGGPTGMALRG